jgi:hypothetical protein
MPVAIRRGKTLVKSILPLILVLIIAILAAISKKINILNNDINVGNLGTNGVFKSG